MERYRIQKQTTCWMAVFLISLFLIRCKQEPLVYTTSTNVNITSYLDQHLDQYSLFRRMLERTETDGFLQAYGKYTLFLPTNDGVKSYLNRIGKTSVDDIELDELKALVNFHILPDVVSTGSFGDGKINSITLHGQYLTTGANNTGGTTKLVINKQAAIIAANFTAGNGIIHVLDDVLEPARYTVAQLLENNPAEYSIFTKALKETGWYDSLNYVPSKNPVEKWKYLTVLAESNTVLNAAGFKDYDDLKKHFSPGANSNPKSVADSLHMYIGYHIIPGARYFSDIRTSTTLNTLAPLEVLSVRKSNQDVYINDIIFNKKYEPGVMLDKEASDVSASNGVLQTTKGFSFTGGTSAGHFYIKVRKAEPVYWDVSDFPEIRALPALFRTGGTEMVPFPKKTSTTSPVDGWDWTRTYSSATNPKYDLQYKNLPGMVNNDCLWLTFAVSAPPNTATANSWMYMKTPVIVKGKYRVWICYKRDTGGGGNFPVGRRLQCSVSLDGVFLPKPFDFSETPPILNTHSELESQGWKYYNASNTTLIKAASEKPYVAKYVGVVEVTSTNVHRFRLDVIQGNQGADKNQLDMVHFIPVDWPSQVLPRFRADGTEDYTPLP